MIISNPKDSLFRGRWRRKQRKEAQKKRERKEKEGKKKYIILPNTDLTKRVRQLKCKRCGFEGPSTKFHTIMICAECVRSKRRQSNEKILDRYTIQIKQLVDLGKGEIEDYHFFGLVEPFCPWRTTSLAEIGELLRGAWWIERDDIRQHLFYWTKRGNMRALEDFYFALKLRLRDFLVRKENDLFRRQTNWREEYKIHEINNKTHTTFNTEAPAFIFKKDDNYPTLTPYDRYLFYLIHSLELPENKIYDVMTTYQRQFFRSRENLRAKLEDIYD